ncbi:MAG TPA: PAS domain S-box protein [Methylomirabilota bacterium]|nr:PAS domain S-box protein [Methylomirabilota bacterium]
MKDEPIKVLLVEDSPAEAEALLAILESVRNCRFTVQTTHSGAEAAAALDSHEFDVVLLDIAFSPQGLKGVPELHAKAPLLPVIIVSAVEDDSLAIQAARMGAQDYLVRSEMNPHLLDRAIRYAIERHRSEAALLQAQEKYRSIFEHTVEGIFQTTPQGQYISANPALARIYGYDSAEALMAGMQNIGSQLYVEPTRRAEFIALMEKHDVVRGFESRIYRKDGSIIWISENVRAVRNAQGRIEYYEGTVEDITERRQSEQRLRDSEALYHSLVETLPQNIFRKNLQAQFTFANTNFCRILGRKLEDILGKTDFDFFPPELAAKYQQDDHKIIETGKSLEIIEEHKTSGGESLYVDVVKTPLFDAQGNIIGLQGIFWDITEKKRAEEALKAANLEIARSREELRARNNDMQEDLKMAREIQQAILPQQYPCFPLLNSSDSALQFCHRYMPAGLVGGDFFNIRALSDSRAAIFIGDVMGHGVRSALVTAILRALVEELTEIAKDPGELLAQVNRDLRAILKQTGTPLYTTAVYLIIDLDRRELVFANAGHPRPLMLHRGTGHCELLANDSRKSHPALGLLDDVQYTVTRRTIADGDLILLYTDGVLDVDGDQELSPEWLAQQVARRSDADANAIFDEVLQEVREVSHKGEFEDDVCLVGMDVRLQPAPSRRRRSAQKIVQP